MARPNLDKLLTRIDRKVGKDVITKAILSGCSKEEIVAAYNVSAKEVELQYNYISKLKETASDFKERKADELNALMDRIVQSISDKDLEEATLQQKLVSVGILEDKLANIEGRNNIKIEIEHKLMDALMESRKRVIDVIPEEA